MLHIVRVFRVQGLLEVHLATHDECTAVPAGSDPLNADDGQCPKLQCSTISILVLLLVMQTEHHDQFQATVSHANIKMP